VKRIHIKEWQVVICAKNKMRSPVRMEEDARQGVREEEENCSFIQEVSEEAAVSREGKDERVRNEILGENSPGRGSRRANAGGLPFPGQQVSLNL
jgi:hypothetical protein